MNIITGVASILIGGGLFAFVQFLITRHDSQHDKFKLITDAIQVLSDKVDSLSRTWDERNAIAMRVRILRFADEMMQDHKHSKDSWDQCMTDITGYENYCAAYPSFKNKQTEATVEYIKKNYAERLERHDFL